MMSKEQALHKLEKDFSNLKELVERAIDEGWRLDEVERESFVNFLDMGLMVLTAVVVAQEGGNKGEQVEHQGKTLRRLQGQHQRRYRSIYGPLEIARYVYGTREGQKIDHVPLDARLI